MIDCDHQWNWDKEIRFCLRCRQVRTFPKDNEEPKVIWQGIDDKRSPLELPEEDKSILAHFAKELGIKKATDCIKIPLIILRAWCGAYCRKEKLPKLNTTLESPKRKYERKPKVELREAPAKLEESLKSPLSTEVVKSNLPPFPVFNDSWEAPVQSEWLVTYLELAKLGVARA